MPPKRTSPLLDWKLNIVSLANLGTLFVIAFTAIGTWYGVTYKVETAQQDIRAIKEQITQNAQDRKQELTDLHQKDDFLTNTIRTVQDEANKRLYGIESKVEVQSYAVRRIESSVNQLTEKLDGTRKPE